YLRDTLPLLPADSPEYPLDLLTLVESILEDPDLILRRQLDMLKTERLAELKAQGVEYDQRMAELEAMEHPKPLREFIYSTFNAFAEKHPWLGNENIRPKSIAREMLEGFYTFSNFIKRYGLERSEGLLLRHLNSVYKVLANTVPEGAKTEEVREMEAFFRDLVHRVDASLLEEWERLQNPDFRPAESVEPRPPGAEEAEKDITRDVKGFTAAIRARIFTFLAALGRGDVEGALEGLNEGLERPSGWTPEQLRDRLKAYREGHGPFRLDPEGRAFRHTQVDSKSEAAPDAGGRWRVRQMLQDPEGLGDWAADFAVDLAASREAGEPVLELIGIGCAE
ncbi:MAG TPA: DUF3516 domain-containing protein, partial [Fibrobacteria bacterium]|nr:DUF3516 domain-containing protein [Fibrobacteria bacterium]